MDIDRVGWPDRQGPRDRRMVARQRSWQRVRDEVFHIEKLIEMVHWKTRSIVPIRHMICRDTDSSADIVPEMVSRENGSIRTAVRTS